MPVELLQRLKGASLVFFDGTFWQDNEMIAQGVGTKTGRRMGQGIPTAGYPEVVAAL